ncbi:hypothetical protein Leryth_011919 [Lithospermum erythrorhizon]|nr:hypothetical protein Leryth_011919 [Lithospermum erythrorhizon]
MCQSPPSPPVAIGSYWTDEHIVMYLDEIMKGSLLPEDVIADMNPYQFSPSNLPEGIWYLLHSDEKKETELGSWKEKGEACRIYENSKITGWRTTREFFQGPPLALKKTDWVIQEYKITQNKQCEQNKLMEQDCRILCRIFNCRGEGSSSGLHLKLKDSDVTERNFSNSNSTIPSIGTTCEHNHASSMKNMELSVAEENPQPVSEALLELDCILRGDYLELDDLVDEEWGCSSSDNSSCVSTTSDECFDSLALLRDLEDDINKDIQEKAFNSKFIVSASAKSDKVILQPATQGMLIRILFTLVLGIIQLHI